MSDESVKNGLSIYMQSRGEFHGDEITLNALDGVLPLTEAYELAQRTVALAALRVSFIFCALIACISLLASWFTQDYVVTAVVSASFAAASGLSHLHEKGLGLGAIKFLSITGFLLEALYFDTTTGSGWIGAYTFAPSLLLLAIFWPRATTGSVVLSFITSVLFGIFTCLYQMDKRFTYLGELSWLSRHNFVTDFFCVSVSAFLLLRIITALVATLRRQDRLSRLTFYKSLGAVASLRDSDTGAHMKRCAIFSRIIAGNDPVGPFSGQNQVGLTALDLAVPLHDIGKVGIPDSILLKPEKLTVEEFSKMKRHTLIGWDLIRTFRDQVGMGHDRVLELAENIALAHHENWDGSGYPFGLKMDDIPYEARVMAIVDVYDALRSPRSYKGGLSHGEALRTMDELVGRKFDPRLYEIFRSRESDFARLYEVNSDLRMPSTPLPLPN